MESELPSQSCPAQFMPQNFGLLKWGKIISGLNLKQHCAPKNCAATRKQILCLPDWKLKTFFRINVTMLAYLHQWPQSIFRIFSSPPKKSLNLLAVTHFPLPPKPQHQATTNLWNHNLGLFCLLSFTIVFSKELSILQHVLELCSLLLNNIPLYTTFYLSIHLTNNLIN